MTATENGKRPKTREQWDTLFRGEFEKESDRACVILALLEQALETLLKARLVQNPSAQDSLFDGPNAPLTSFEANPKLVCAQCDGL